jgi:hypothetical protein
MRLLRNALVLVPLLALAFQCMVPEKAGGLPLFARKYSIPCTSCHLAFPRLNTFGMAFKQNGYRMPGQKGESPWEAKEFPLSVVGNVGYTYTSTDAADSTGARSRTATSAFVQNTSEFHSAGTLAEKITFHFDNDFAGVNGPLTSGLAFVMFDDVVKEGGLNVKVGVYDADTPYLADSRRTTWTHYLSPITLDGLGVELNGTKTGWTYAVGLNNSSRTIGKAGDKTLNNAEKPYAWLMRDVRGQLVCARVVLDRQDPRDSTRSGSLHTQAELNAYVNSGRWVVIPGFTYEKFQDANPAVFDPEDPATGARDKVMTGLMEGLLFLDKDSRWLLTGRYEIRHMPKFDFQGMPAFAEEDDQQIVANVSWYANPNAKVGLEWTHDSDNIQGPKIDQVQLFVHIGY